MITDYKRSLLEKAQAERNWEPLVGYNDLLFFYQTKNKDAMMPIAKFASHKLGIHRWCKTDEECRAMDDLIRTYAPKSLLQPT